MTKKRKNDSNATEASSAAKRQTQPQNQPELVEPKSEQVEQEEQNQPEELLHPKGEQVEQVKQEEEEEEEVDEVEEDDSNQNESDDAEDEEPIEKLLEPFSKAQLVNLLREAADNHSDVTDVIRKVADEDPAHRKIFVHGLGWDTNTESLRKAFESYGEIEDCKAVCDKVSGKSKGYGFILFKRRSGARKALVEPHKKIGSRMTACQLASIGPGTAPSSAAPAVAAPQVQQPVSEHTQRKIYVSNVAPELDPQSLLAFFSRFGEIEDGPLGLDKATGKPKGFCLFVYRSVESAKKALEEPHKNFEGHMLHCQKAIDGPKPGKSQQQQQQHSMRSSHFQRNDNSAYSAGPSHLMAPGAGIGFNQGASVAPAFNPALGQALTAMLASQGAGLGLTNLLGSLGSATAVTQPITPGIQNAYGNQASFSPGMIGAYGNQAAVQNTYPNQQMGQAGAGRGQHGVGQYGGAGPYMGL